MHMVLRERPSAVQKVVELADGLFIYANTIVKYITQDKCNAPRVYDMLINPQRQSGPPRMYDRHDVLYGTILENAFGQFQHDSERMGWIRQVLYWPVLRATDIWRRGQVTAQDLALVGIPSYVTMDVVERLQSVLIVEGNISLTTPLKAYQLSFTQFLVDEARCRDIRFLVKEKEGHAVIASGLLGLMARDNAEDMRGRDGRLEWMWMYAMQEWDHHLLDAADTDQLRHSLHKFAESHLRDCLFEVLPWQYAWSWTHTVDRVAIVRARYKVNSDASADIITPLDRLIEDRATYLVTEVPQVSDQCKKWEVDLIENWRTNGYTPGPPPEQYAQG